jgi:tripartite-type tricarboxylate transporter receptor subunit TctC
MLRMFRTVALLLGVFALSANAQTYPNKPIRLVVPYPPGALTDLLGRAIGERLAAAFKQPVVIDNRPGAGTLVGAEAVAKSPADGYTLLMATSNILAINPALYSKVPFDSLKDFAPVSIVVSLNNVLVLNPGVKANSVKELIALIKSQPGKETVCIGSCARHYRCCSCPRSARAPKPIRTSRSDWSCPIRRAR